MKALASVAVLLTVVLASTPAAAERVTLSLNGTWQVADSVAAEPAPKVFPATVAVPGLVHNATPAFADVDAFDSLELVANQIAQKRRPESARVPSPGLSRQERNYFWYRRTFTVASRKSVATLRVNKAQFGTAVWLNGRKVGEYPGCFSAGVFDLTPALRWQGENVLLVRVGAHPGVLPATFPAGTDFEKLKWTPGIYDEVSLQLSDNPVIESVQVAPRVASSELLVETRVGNRSAAPVSFELAQAVTTWKGGERVATGRPEPLTLAPGESRAVRQTIAIASASLWSPESPFLYVLETSTGGDSVATRFGMREFRFDTATKRAYLNGRPYFLRGSNITLHRFFEDPESGTLPWDEAWVRRLLVDIPKRMGWNAFRFCIGPVPDRWLDVADEAGLLVQNEFFVWTGSPDWGWPEGRTYDVPEMVRQYSDWMRDNWNHPSVAVWDANNETRDPVFGDRIIPTVRPLDLSNRPWENSYNQPVGPDDPVEDHPYLTQAEASGRPDGFRMTDLERRPAGPREAPMAARATVLNEYGWLWLRRDGEPTVLTEALYPKLLGPGSTKDERLELNAYLLAGETEYWRAHRNYAGILHFVYLTCSYPGVFTADHFADVAALRLNPWFEDYMGEAMKPLGVYLAFFQPALVPGSRRSFRVMMVNDLYAGEKGELRLTLEDGSGREVARAARPFDVAPLGTLSRDLELTVPAERGRYLLKATAVADSGARTVSRRKVAVGD
ncbi:MAG TPA: glycoside hydrolase family 2 TIM barrel-domain containing protein, partial [Vicinamibacteria bacterium]|nr:glycoside hydrolase family 2 TIM barrel-domain containing protein [Vicinamibacteria bacterium]